MRISGSLLVVAVALIASSYSATANHKKFGKIPGEDAVVVTYIQDEGIARKTKQGERCYLFPGSVVLFKGEVGGLPVAETTFFKSRGAKKVGIRVPVGISPCKSWRVIYVTSPEAAIEWEKHYEENHP